MCDSYPSAYQERLVTARLPHTCFSCGFAIMRGELYQHASGIWDGDPADYKRHLLCVELDRQSGEDERCWTFGELQDARDSDDHSWTFRRAWETVTRRPWNDDDHSASTECP